MENINFYHDDIYIQNKDKKRKYLILFLIPLLVFIVLFILIFVIVNRQNYLAIEISFSIILTLTFIYLAYFYLNDLLPILYLCKHLNLIQKEDAVVLHHLEIIEIKNKKITLSSRVKSYEIQTKNENNEIKTYYLIDIFDVQQIALNQKVTLKISSSYIREIIYEK